MKKTKAQVFAFEVTVVGTDWEKTVHTTSAGKAKSEYLRDVRDAYPDMPFTAIRCRKLGAPRSDAEFLRVAAYRGLPHVRIGDRVRAGESCGVIVGHNSSANFDVLFDAHAPRYGGQVLNVHPGSLEFLDSLTRSTRPTP